MTVQVDLGNVPENWEEIVKKCGLLKRNCFAAVFEKYFEFQVIFKIAELDVVIINEIEYSIDGLFQELYAEAENVSKY